jgi:hypothetical protein
LLTLALLIATPAGSKTFWLLLAALIALIAMQALFWLVTQPANKYWLADQKLGAAAARFFSANAAHSGPRPDWTALRDRWEYSRVARAASPARLLSCCS